jgi:oligopeptide transport system substrate-binding protein
METEKFRTLDQKLKELVDRFPRLLDNAIFKERDRLIAYFDQEFLHKRSIEHLLRLLSSHYLKKKKLLGIVSLAPKSRGLELRIMPTKLEFPFGSKWVIGILVQVSLYSRYELFDQEQLLRAVQKIIPDLRIVKGSVYMFQGSDDTIKTLYAEFEKNGNQYFTLSELKLLKKSLGDELLLRIERLVPAVFMTRNQEEVLRNILTLSQEIDSISDLPQVMISFEMQTAEEFVFTVICVRPEDDDSTPVDNLMKQQGSFFHWQLERKQLVKYLDQHRPIFAYTFRALLTPHPTILRSDGSLNFFVARQKIANCLKENIGEFRDFNGGILIKQEETLDSLKNDLPDISPELIENIFYSIAPIEMQAILSLPILKILLQLFLQVEQSPLLDPSHYILRSCKKDDYHLILIRIPNGTFYELAKDHLLSFDLPEAQQASIALSIKDSHLFGYLLNTQNSRLQNRFLESLEKLLLYWSEEVKKQQVLRLSLEYPVPSLDPRIGGDGVSVLFLKMLFEGLMKIGPSGALEKGIAESVEISPDRKTYTFRLRPSVWSNNTPLTSYDFEYAWKKILSPHFNTPFTYLFYPIKNAELVKKGIVPMNQVGIQALTDNMLKVELESPSAHFLEFLALPIFSPVCRQVDINEPNWPSEESARYICNGAFKLEKNHKDTSYVLTKNPFYWDRGRIHLDRVIVTTSHYTQNYEMFLQNKIHWIGAPWGAWEKNFKPGDQDERLIYQDNGVYWCVCNTKHPFLKHPKIRKALAYAINRGQLLDTLQYPSRPAYSPLPDTHSQIKQPFPEEEAASLFAEALEESGLSRDTLPPLTISYTQRTIHAKPAAEFLSSQWKQKLGLKTIIDGADYKTVFSKLTSGDFDITLIRWHQWVNDPFYTLNFFANSDEPMNFSKWSNADLQGLLFRAQMEIDEDRTKLLLKQIEKMLIDEMPIIPLFETCFQFMKKKSLVLTPTHALMDFKWSRLKT